MYYKICKVVLAPLVVARALVYYLLFVDQLPVCMLFLALVGNSVVTSAPASELYFWALLLQSKELMLCMASWNCQILSFSGLVW